MGTCLPIQTAILALLLFGSPLSALDPDQIIQPSAEAAEQAREATAASPTAPGASVFIVYGLLLLGGGYAFARHLRRGGPRLSSSADRGIELARTRSLGSRQYLMVVQVEGKRMLLGAGPGFITHLSDLSKDDGAAPLAAPGKTAPDVIHELPGNSGSQQFPFNTLITRINERLGRGDAPRT